MTVNLRDFPPETLAKYNIEVLHPDDFIHNEFGFNHTQVVIAAKACRGRSEIRRRTAEEYLATLEAPRASAVDRQARSFSN